MTLACHLRIEKLILDYVVREYPKFFTDETFKQIVEYVLVINLSQGVDGYLILVLDLPTLNCHNFPPTLLVGCVVVLEIIYFGLELL